MAYSEENDVGRRNSGDRKKGIIIALLVFVTIAVAAYVLGAGSSFSKIPAKSSASTGLFGLFENNGSGDEGAQDENLNFAEFKNSKLNAELSVKGLNFEVSGEGVIKTQGSAVLETPGMTESLKSGAKISGFEGEITANSQEAKIAGDLKSVESDCCLQEFEEKKSALITAQSLSIEDLSAERIEGTIQGILEIESENGKSRVELSKDSKAIIEGFNGRVSIQNGKAIISGSAESLRVLKEQ